MVHFTSIVSNKVVLGKNVVKYIAGSSNCYIQGINGIYIGDNTMIGPGVRIISANHALGKHDEHIKSESIYIGENCWLGTNSCILPGVKLGNNVIVGAGSVVTKSFESNVIIGGNPAKTLKKREDSTNSDN